MLRLCHRPELARMPVSETGFSRADRSSTISVEQQPFVRSFLAARLPMPRATFSFLSGIGSS